MTEKKALSLRIGNHVISMISPGEAVDWVLDAIKRRDHPTRQVMASGFHGLWAVVSDPKISAELERVDLWVPDGIAPVLMARTLGGRDLHRVPGPDLFSAVLRTASVRGPIKHFLYGDTPDTLDALATRIEAEYPGNQVVGVHSPPFTTDAEAAPDDTIDVINRSGADALWVGLGTPKQDLWIARNRDRLTVPVALAVGAAFRFEIGKVERAPDWVGRSGLEWAYRLSREPRKLWRRVFIEGTGFLAWVIPALIAGRVFLEPQEFLLDR